MTDEAAAVTVARLATTDLTVRRLATKHRALDQQIAAMDTLLHLTAPQAYARKRLQKQKLHLKDQLMARINSLAGNGHLPPGREGALEGGLRAPAPPRGRERRTVIRRPSRTIARPSPARIEVSQGTMSPPRVRTTGNPQARTAPARATREGTMESAAHRARRLLVISGQPSSRRTLREAVQALGHQVLEADSGAAGINLLLHQPIDLVLTDQRLPGLSGCDIARLAKALRPRLPVVLLTETADTVPIAHADWQYVDALLPIPWETPRIRRVLEPLL
jgi:CheY-like chemotaxis protein/uncharacterized protein YdcH (DUF465 family)